MVVLLLDTRSFSFMAFGTDEAHARRVLAAAWIEHCEATDADRHHVNPDEDGNVYPVTSGSCLRDDFELVKGVK